MSRMRNPDSIVIGLGGEKGAGKDALAAAISEKGITEKPVMVMGMSDALSEIIRVMNPIIKIPLTFEFSSHSRLSIGELDLDSFPEDGKFMYAPYREVYEALVDADDDAYTEMKRIQYVRTWLQTMGTDVGRKMIHEEVWTRIVRSRILEAQKTHDVIITGIRFPNELEMIKDVGGLSVYVNRKLAEDSNSSHASETSLTNADFDVNVNNYGTLKQLREEIAPTFTSYVRALW